MGSGGPHHENDVITKLCKKSTHIQSFLNDDLYSKTFFENVYVKLFEKRFLFNVGINNCVCVDIVGGPGCIANIVVSQIALKGFYVFRRT